MTQVRETPPGMEPRAEARRFPTLELLILGVVATALLRPVIVRFMESSPALQTWATIFVSISLQAFPFLILGVVLAGAIVAFVPSRFLVRAFLHRPAVAVPLAGVAGCVLPGCECGSVPISARLVARGVLPAAALAFMLSAPAINPVVLVSTAVAFPGRPIVVVARFVASLLTAVVVGLLWARLGRDAYTARARRSVGEDGRPWATFRDSVRHDFLHAGGFLVVGAAAAATIQVAVPRSILDSVAGSGPIAVLILALLAVALSICSEADAFVAASLGQFSLTARLAFLVVGPAVDIKLVALQAGLFGRPFALRFAPLTFGVAVVLSAIVGWVLL
ncbi:MAG: permease [Actinomycetota bacterium]